MYDVIISGAGPAGSKCAEAVAKSGFKVALIEKDTTWRKPCGGAIHSRVFKYFPQLRKMNFKEIKAITLYSADYHRFTSKWMDPMNYSINVDRLEFDKHLRNFALDAGAEIFDKNLSYDFIIKNNRRVGIKTKSGSGTKEYYGKIIIIADGMSSKLAAKSGIKKKWEMNQLIFAKCAIMEGENNIDKDSISIFFQPHKGYGWIFPLDDKKFNIGCGILGESPYHYNLNQIYSEFFNNTNIKKFFPKSSYKKIWESSYPLPGLGVTNKSLYGENVMIIGDAAGFVSPISGEGISPSIVSGSVAAETAIKALEKEEISSNTLKKYRSHNKIKTIIRNFKLNLSLVDFFFENRGRNLSSMFAISEKDEKFREELTNMFLFSRPPSKDFLLNLKSKKSD